MAKCKCKSTPCPEGVPGWIVTYGDMMSLLLCFFILLAAFSELKREEEYTVVAHSVMQAFGFTQGSGGSIPTDQPSMQSVVTMLTKAASAHDPRKAVSQSDVEGVQGKYTTVQTVREGLMFTLGGASTFDRESAFLKDEVKEELRAIARLIDGRRNRIFIRGHADAKRLSPSAPWTNLYQLGYARAEAVMLFLTEEVGMKRELFRVESCADHEPINVRARREDAAQVNRRVEIIVSDSVIEEFNPDSDYTDPANARGG
ncbi:MAG: OmpA family protein [Phycisphaerales bacterium]|nr:OmpA family protein [Phycisphaerales bacterium]